MEEDIDKLEDFLEYNAFLKDTITGDDMRELEVPMSKNEYKAIENLIARYKTIKAQKEAINNKRKELEKELEGFKDGKYISLKVNEMYIPKSKVKEKIEEYRNKRNELANGHFWDNPDNINQDTALFIAGETLKQLLED